MSVFSCCVLLHLREQLLYSLDTDQFKLKCRRIIATLDNLLLRWRLRSSSKFMPNFLQWYKLLLLIVLILDFACIVKLGVFTAWLLGCLDVAAARLLIPFLFELFYRRKPELRVKWPHILDLNILRNAEVVFEKWVQVGLVQQRELWLEIYWNLRQN